MNTTKNRMIRGFTLIEALISLVVFSVGMLSVASLHNAIISSSGLSKARTEAVQIAENNLEQLRNLIVQGDFTAVATSATTQVSGTNATFAVNRVVTNTTIGSPVSKRIEVTVAWTDPKDGAQQVRVSDTIAWNDPAKGYHAATQNPGPTVPPMKTPTGRAVQGGRTYDTLPTGSINNNDGTYTYVADDGKRELLVLDGDDYKAVLTVADGSQFSTISGRVYSADLALSAADVAETFVLSSDASYCADTRQTIQFWRASGANKKYAYYTYNCYVGAEWYGNVGIVRTGNFNSNDRICLGTPDQSDTSAWNSLHPVLSSVRHYRGFKTVVNTADTSVGIGIDPATGAYAPQTYTDHDFLLSRITGQPDNSACNAPLKLISATDPFGIYTGKPSADNNPGLGFCFTPLCGTGTVTPPTETVITFAFVNSPANFNPDVTLSINGGTCSRVESASNKLVGYQCTMVWAGWVGETWTGTINVTSNGNNGGLLCSSGATTPVTVPTVAGGISAVIAGQTIVYTAVPIALETIGQTVTIAKTAGNCP